MTQRIFKASLAAASLLAGTSLALADDWSGPYIGIGGGYGIANEELNFSPGPLIAPLLSGNIDLDGVASKGGFLSISAGYDHRLNKSLLIGAFVDYDFYDMDGGLSLSVPPLLGASVGFKVENQLSVGGRIGYIASPSTLIFADAGYAHVETSDINFAVGIGGRIGFSGTLAGVPSFDGYFLGGGIETKIGHGLSVKAEYRYTDLGPERLDLLPGLGVGGFITSTMEPVIQTGRLSLNYRFGDHSSAPEEDVAPVGRNWTGGYISAGIGQGAASEDVTLTNRPPVPAFSADLDGAGFHGGVFGVGAGYDVQMGSRFVIGAFADANFSEMDNKNSLNLAVGPLSLNGDLNARIENLFMIGGRLGYLASPDTLIFGSLGYANADFSDLDFHASVSVGGPPPLARIDGTLIDGKRMSGFFLGGGIEARLTDALALKAEYRYIDFGSEEVALLPALAPIVNNFVKTEVDPAAQIGMVSLVYRFGGRDPAPAPLK